MTPAERGLLVAIGRVVSEGTGRVRLLRMIEAVEREDQRRPFNARMPAESLEDYNARIVAQDGSRP
jgi:hypothetical protein